MSSLSRKEYCVRKTSSAQRKIDVEHCFQKVSCSVCLKYPGKDPWHTRVVNKICMCFPYLGLPVPWRKYDHKGWEWLYLRHCVDQKGMFTAVSAAGWKKEPKHQCPSTASSGTKMEQVWPRGEAQSSWRIHQMGSFTCPWSINGRQRGTSLTGWQEPCPGLSPSLSQRQYRKAQLHW